MGKCGLISDKYIQVCDDKAPYCNPNDKADTIYGVGCSNYDVSKFDCKGKDNGSYCITVDNKDYLYMCDNGELYSTPDYCGEGNDCIVLEDEPQCLKSCTKEEIGNTYGLCNCWGSCSTLNYECKETETDKYYYQFVDADACGGYCQNDMSCGIAPCSVFYKPRCSGTKSIKFCENDQIAYKSCNTGTECVNYNDSPECLKPCSKEDVGNEESVCGCSGESCVTSSKICTEINDKYYIIEQTYDCIGKCNDNNTACTEE